MKTTKYTFDIIDDVIKKALYVGCKYEMPGKHTKAELVTDIKLWAKGHHISGFTVGNIKVVA